MLTKNVIAIDLAKNVLQACHINIHGELLSNKPLSLQKMKEFWQRLSLRLSPWKVVAVVITGDN